MASPVRSALRPRIYSGAGVCGLRIDEVVIADAADPGSPGFQLAATPWRGSRTFLHRQRRGDRHFVHERAEADRRGPESEAGRGGGARRRFAEWTRRDALERRARGTPPTGDRQSSARTVRRPARARIQRRRRRGAGRHGGEERPPVQCVHARHGQARARNLRVHRARTQALRDRRFTRRSLGPKPPRRWSPARACSASIKMDTASAARSASWSRCAGH